MKKFFFPALLAAFFAIGFTASDEDLEGPTPTPDDKPLTGIVRLDSKIGKWDAGYLTPSGYFTEKLDFNKNLKATRSDDGGSNYSSISYLSKDGNKLASLISTKKDNLPTQLVIKDEGIIYFSYPNDSIVEMVFDDGKNVALMGSYIYFQKDLPGASKGDTFRATLANASALMKANVPAATRAEAGDADDWAALFDDVSSLEYEDNPTAVDEIPVASSGDYVFSEIIEDWYGDEIGDYVCNSLSLWTGEAKFKVGGSSCTLSGSVYCLTGAYNEYGTYGIICDADKSKLQLGEAEYEGAGYQAEGTSSFGVDFRGFKPNTTYYYKAYYKFNSADHGSLVVKYGDPTDEVIYDTTVKQFTTGDNVLTVDVVMCIDVTGSMSGIINTVKRNAIGFYDSFKSCCDEEGITLAGLNAQVIAFRDKNVDSSWLESSSTYWLPDEKDAFNGFVNGLYASGGGDIPESGLEALDAAFKKTDWSIDDGYHRQVVILWTDAPYLIGTYANVTLDEVATEWNAMPSGRRLILFAPNGNGYSNGGDWRNLDGWKNLIHETDLYSGFNNFEYILKSIIGELTSKARTDAAKTSVVTTYFTPNE
jgi:hypothetical protein